MSDCLRFPGMPLLSPRCPGRETAQLMLIGIVSLADGFVFDNSTLIESSVLADVERPLKRIRISIVKLTGRNTKRAPQL